MNIPEFITLFAALTNFLLGILVLGRGANSKLNQKFALFSFVTAAWVFANYIVSLKEGVFSLSLTYAVGALIMPAALFWFYELIGGKHLLKTLLVLVAGIGAILVSVWPGALIAGVVTSSSGSQIEYGKAFVVYAVLLVGSLLLFTFELLFSLVRAKKERKKQVALVLIGVAGTISVVIFAFFILPIFGINLVSPIDAQSSLFFVGFSAFSIIKYRFMDVRVISTQLVVSLLTIFLFSRIFFSADSRELTINIVIFTLGFLIGLLLIRSVIQEVKRREEVERLNRQLADFLRFGTHELRAPLGGIRGYTSLILEGSFGKCDPELYKTVQKIRTEIDRLLLLVETFLDANHARQGKLEVVLEPTEVKDSIEKASGILEAAISLKGLQLEKDIDSNLPTIKADPRKILIILGNILSNAFKYTEKGTITVKAMRSGENVVISVKDTGIGIPAKVLPHLFSQFERGSDRAKKMATGSGIGLYLTKKLVDAMEATIDIKSKGKDKGTTVVLTFKPMQGTPRALSTGE